MEDKKDIYYKYFDEKILSKIVILESERIHIVKKVVLSSSLYFLAGLFLAFIVMFVNFSPIYKFILIPLILFLMYACILKSIVNFIIAGKDFQALLYEKVLPLFLPPFANFKKWPKNHNTDVIIDSQLFHNFDTQEDVSSFFGFYNGTNIIISDSRLKMPVKGVNKPDMFKGTLIEFELGKSIDNHVIMFSKNEKKFNNFRQINPHIEEMNKYLYIFAKNNKNLEFISEVFWNTVKRFGEVYTAKGFELSYKDNVVLIAIRQKKPMLFGFLFRSLLKAKNYDDLIERFIVIFDLVDILNS